MTIKNGTPKTTRTRKAKLPNVAPSGSTELPITSESPKVLVGVPEIKVEAPTTELGKLCVEIQSLQRQRTILLKSRNMQANRLQAVVAGTLGYSSHMPEKERTKKFQEASELIKKIQAGEAVHPLAGVIRTTMIGITAFNDMKDELEKEMVKLAKKLPVAPWVNKPEQRGFGLLFLAIVIGETGDFIKFSNPSKLWKRLGCAPYTFDGKTLMGATWRSGREGKLPSEEWEKFGYNPRRRSIAYLIGEGIVKQNGKDSEDAVTRKSERGATARTEDGPYRARYDEAERIAFAKHPEWDWKKCEECKGVGCPKCNGLGVKCKRAHLHGMLLATKRLLREMYNEWKRTAGDSSTVTDSERS